jgi:hypothetical protein
MSYGRGEFKRLEKVCRDPDCVGNPKTGEPSRYPEDFYRGRLVCKFCCRRRAKERRDEDPERTRAQNRNRKAQQRRLREVRDRIVLAMARSDMRRFLALVWAELKPDLSRGEIEDWVARMVPPDPEGMPRGDVKENYRREYGALMFDRLQPGRKNGREMEGWYADVAEDRESDEE